jgi:hypothetical protein
LGGAIVPADARKARVNAAKEKPEKAKQQRFPNDSISSHFREFGGKVESLDETAPGDHHGKAHA